MAYTPNIWVDREGTTRYFEIVEKDGAKIFTPDYSQLTEIGTPVNADNMNHIEEGIAAGSFTKYDSNTVYQINDLVTSFEGSELKVYKSLKSENYNNPVTDTTYWSEVELGGGGSGFSLFDIVQKDHVLSFEESKGLAMLGSYVYKNGVAGSRYGYADFYEKCLEEKELGETTETTFGESTITIYTNANGHQFYNITDKAVIDTLFESRGEAMFYGIDEENERIFLPRRTRTQTTLNPDEVNGFIEAGLPNITGQISQQISSSDGVTNGCFTSVKGQVMYGASFGTENRRVKLDASLSNSIYGNSDTVQPSGSLVLEYMVVGNVTVDKAQTDVTEITTSENDTLPLLYNFYSKEDMTPTGAYANASLGSWLSGNVYLTVYNELVNKLGTGNVKSVIDEYTDYDFVVNQDDMTFRLPLLNGSEDLLGDRYIDLTLKASGAFYTAPANGFFVLQKAASADQQYIWLQTNPEDSEDVLYDTATYSAGSGSVLHATAKVRKGQRVYVAYTAGGVTQYFRFVYAKGNGSLYYKVANAVTNLELLDVAKIESSKADKTAVDGQWVQNYLLVASGLSFPKSETGTTYDLSTYLPNDGYDYEVLFSVAADTGKTSGNTAGIRLGTDIIPIDLVTACTAKTQASNAVSCGATVALPVGSGRYVQIRNSGNATGTLNWIRAVAYRRLGTNP